MAWYEIMNNMLWMIMGFYSPLENTWLSIALGSSDSTAGHSAAHLLSKVYDVHANFFLFETLGHLHQLRKQRSKKNAQMI